MEQSPQTTITERCDDSHGSMHMKKGETSLANTKLAFFRHRTLSAALFDWVFLTARKLRGG